MLLKTLKMKSMSTFQDYEETQRIVREIGFNTVADYRLAYKEYGLPSNPPKVFKGKGWVDWGVFLGKRDDEYPPFKDAMKIVRENGIKSMGQYKRWYKKYGLPSHPELYYQDKGWTSYLSFWGKSGMSNLSIEEAKHVVKKEGVKNRDEYRLFSKNLGLPSHPDLFFRDKGWMGWNDFFGKTSPRTTQEERKYNIFSKLSITPALLKEDAPLHAIYILASRLDKKLAKEIEELLGKTTYEERLEWVKNQLEKLKEGTKITFGSTDDTPSDELSAMEYIVKGFGNLSDELKTSLENYLHSAVNRELISEYDG